MQVFWDAGKINTGSFTGQEVQMKKLVYCEVWICDSYPVVAAAYSTVIQQVLKLHLQPKESSRPCQLSNVGHKPPLG